MNHNHFDDRDLKWLAQTLQRMFRVAKEEQNGQAYRPHDRFKNPRTWEQAARYCIQAGADPYSYIRAAFLYCSHQGTPRGKGLPRMPGGPFPNNLASKAGLRWFEEYKKSFVRDGSKYKTVYQAEIQASFVDAVERQMASRKSPSDFFLDDVIEKLDVVPAFVRVTLLPEPAIIKKYGNQTYADFAGNPVLLQTVKDLGFNVDFMDLLRK